MMTRFSRFFIVCAAVCGCALGASADGVTVSAGCDFTNAIMTVTATGDSPSISIALNGSTLSPQPTPSVSGNVYTYNLTLAAGKLYAYAVTIDSATYKGEILTANLKDGFSSSSSGDSNGSWSPALTFTEGVATVTGATFSVTSALPASKVDVVESVQSFEDGFDEEDLAELDFTGAQAMLIVVTNETSAALEWYAWFGGEASTALSGWTKLSGVTPTPGTTYTVRSEFDYTATSAPKMSVCVKADNGAYTRLSDGSGNIWFSLSNTAKTSVSQVSICGNVAFTSLSGKTSNANLFTDGTTEYADSATALGSGKSLTLLTNVSIAPSRGKWTIDKDGYSWTNTGSMNLQYDSETKTLWAYEAKEAKIGTTEYVFLDEAFTAAKANETVTLLTNVTTTSATTIGENLNLSLDLAGHDYLPTSALTLGTGTFTITNTVIDSGCVEFSTLTTNETSILKIAGGLWSAADKAAYASNLLTDFTFYDVTNTVTRSETTFAYQAKKSTTISVGGNEVKIEDDFIEKNIPGASSMTSNQLSSAMTETRTEGNCMPLIQSYALTLDPNDSTAKPIASAVQNSSSDQMTLSLGNVRVNTGSGVPVKFALKTGTSPDMTGATTGTQQTDPSFTVDLPTSGDAVKYYSIDIQFGNN